MKIIIDIPEKVYNRCKEYRLQCGEAEVLESAVASGTPLNETPAWDVISRQKVSDIIKTRLYQTALNNDECITSYAEVCVDIADNRIDTWINEAKPVEEFSDLKDFVSDIIAVNNNYNNATGSGYYPEDLEVDFDEVMEKWSKKIEHYEWR